MSGRHSLKNCNRLGKFRHFPQGSRSTQPIHKLVDQDRLQWLFLSAACYCLISVHFGIVLWPKKLLPTMLCSPQWLSYSLLSYRGLTYKTYLAAHSAVFSLKADHIHSTGNGFTGRVSAIPHNPMTSGLCKAGDKDSHALTQHIVYGQCYVHRALQFVFDRYRRIERIRKAAHQAERCGVLARPWFVHFCNQVQQVELNADLTSRDDNPTFGVNSFGESCWKYSAKETGAFTFETS